MSTDFDWSKYEDTEQAAPQQESSFDWSKYEEPEEPSTEGRVGAFHVSGEPVMTTLKRAGAQIGQGLLEGPIGGFLMPIIGKSGTGEALSGLEELDPARIAHLRKAFPEAPWPEEGKEIDPKKYLERTKEAGEQFPTVANIARIIESKTGIPLEPKTPADRLIRFVASFGKFKVGALIDKVRGALKAGMMRQGLIAVGYPEPIADMAGLTYGLMEKTPDVTIHPPEKPAVAKPPTGPGVPPPEAPPDIPDLPPGEGLAKYIIPGSERRRTLEDILGKSPTDLDPFAEADLKDLLSEQLQQQEKAVITEQRIKPISPGEPIKPMPEIPKGLPEGQMEKFSLVDKNVKTVEQNIGDLISKDRITSRASTGRNANTLARHELRSQKTLTKTLYDDAEAEYVGFSGPAPDLVNTLSTLKRRITSLSPSASEEMVLREIAKLQKKFGTAKKGYRDISANDLIKTSNSIAEKTNYELPSPGPKGFLKTLVRSLNDEAKLIINNAGGDVGLIEAADRQHGNVADTFLIDEMKPYLKKKVLNPEALADKAIKDPGSLRALNNAVGRTSAGKSLIKKVQRRIVENFVNPYLKSPSKIGGVGYQDSINDLSELIGDKPAKNVKRYLDSYEGIKHPREIARRGAIKEAQLKQVDIARRQRPQLKKSLRQYTSEDIGKAFKSPEGIRKLKSDIRGKPQAKTYYDQLAKQEVQDLLHGDKVEPVYTGDGFYNVLNDRKKAEIIGEIIGHENVKDARAVFKKIGKAEVTRDKVIKLVKGTVLFKVIKKFFIPI